MTAFWIVCGCIIGLPLLTVAFYCGLVLRVYKTESDKLSQGQKLRIVMVSDLHSCRHGKNQEKLLEKIRQQQPDLILLPGDIADDKKKLRPAQDFLMHIATIAPSFYSFGNHEYRSGKAEQLRRTAKEGGVTVLEDTSAQIEINGIPLCICGTGDSLKRRYEDTSYNQTEAMQAAFQRISSDRYNILLAHRSYLVALYQKYPFDLIVSGHAHGGQWRIPGILNGLFVPTQGLFPKYAGGEYRYRKTVHIVGRGVSNSSIIPRIFNPPELVVIDVLPKEA